MEWFIGFLVLWFFLGYLGVVLGNRIWYRDWGEPADMTMLVFIFIAGLSGLIAMLLVYTLTETSSQDYGDKTYKFLMWRSKEK